MSNRFNGAHLLIWILVAALLCILVYRPWTNRIMLKTGTSDERDIVSMETKHPNWTDITDIFVPQGRKYKEKEGIIYNCFGTGPYKTANAPNKTRDINTKSVLTQTGEDTNIRQKSFTQIFEKQTWIREKGGDITSKEYHASGTGSTLKAGQPPLTLLNSLIDRLKIYSNKNVITLLDVPCGDFYWMRELVSRRPDVLYTGIDIVPALIEKHKISYKTMRNAQFKNLDIVESGLDQSYDIIFTRDMLQHLSHVDVMKVLVHFSSSGSKLLVATNMLSDQNIELNIQGGRYRHLNLMLPPVSLVPPLCAMRDDVDNEIKELAIWRLPLKQRV